MDRAELRGRDRWAAALDAFEGILTTAERCICPGCRWHLGDTTDAAGMRAIRIVEIHLRHSVGSPLFADALGWLVTQLRDDQHRWRRVMRWVLSGRPEAVGAVPAASPVRQ